MMDSYWIRWEFSFYFLLPEHVRQVGVLNVDSRAVDK
jgi:hypothetical protein